MAFNSGNTQIMDGCSKQCSRGQLTYDMQAQPDWQLLLSLYLELLLYLQYWQINIQLILDNNTIDV